MAGSSSYGRGAQGRAAADFDAAYDEMIRKQRALNARQEAAEEARRLARNVPPTLSGHPMRGAVNPRPKVPDLVDDVVSAVTHVLGGPRRAREKWERGQRVEALIDGAIAASDLSVGKSATRGILKGRVKVAGPYRWRTKPWEEGEGAREWMGRTGQLAPGQPGHHALIPQNGWGKHVPDWIKNQPANIKAMENPIVHGRIHGPYKGEPQYDYLSRYWLGTPGWWKSLNGSVGGRVVQSGVQRDDER